MSAPRLVTVTLARTWDPARPEEASATIEFAVALDPLGHPDEQAWLDDPDPWPATRFRPGRPPQEGDVAHDEEGWQLRFYAEDGQDPDAPLHRLEHIDGGLRPGEVLTLRAPDGGAAAWRVVGITPREG